MNLPPQTDQLQLLAQSTLLTEQRPAGLVPYFFIVLTLSYNAA